jgi:pyruvate dehydrogenase E1 component beta subunit
MLTPIFTHIPGLKVVCPSNAYDAKGLLIQSIRDNDPVIFLEHKNLYGQESDVPEESYAIPFAEANVIRDGKHATVVTYGQTVQRSIDAASLLAKEGVDCEVIDLRTLSPMDRETVVGSVKKTGRVLVVHEAPKTCGLGAEIAALIGEKALLSLEAPVLRITGWDITPPLPKGEDVYYPNPERVFRGIQRLMEF